MRPPFRLGAPLARPDTRLGAPRILVTGFGGFPGSPKNPTARLIAALGRSRARFARAGLHLDLCILPVIHAGLAPRLAALAKELRPDAILHFGLAARRRTFCVEARALNRVSLLRRDASGAQAESRVALAGAPYCLKASVPVGRIAAALRRSGFDAAVSIDAGDYVCNETLYLSLSRAYAPLIGFIHVPARGARSARRLDLAAVTRAATVAILALAPELRLRRSLTAGAPRLEADAGVC